MTVTAVERTTDLACCSDSCVWIPFQDFAAPNGRVEKWDILLDFHGEMYIHWYLEHIYVEPGPMVNGRRLWLPKHSL